MSLRWYALDRVTDVSGISGTGRVAYALHLPSGRVLLLWDTTFDGEHSHGVETLRTFPMLRQIHTYGGKTRLTPLVPDHLGSLNPEDWASLADANELLDDAMEDLSAVLGELNALRAEVASHE